ncbi:DUF6783 domain-containing protein [Ruminococcus sp. 2227st1_E6_2227SCRN_220401]|uniref:DUF6783 domain-containing protein n=1 Tax=Ruminococcus sp. 2227st1_E6_2227SCRN_220401 TaxID=3143052 RepID=UPI00319DCFD8
MFCPNSVVVARYDALIRTKFPTNCDAHLAESLFQTRSRNFALYIRFTEAEVKTIAEKYNQDYEKKIKGGTHHGTFLFHPTRADRVEC